MPVLENEYEVVKHRQIQHLNVFLVRLRYRTPHIHDELELGLLLEGEVELRKGAERLRFGPGEGYLINALESHEFSALGEEALILSVQASDQLVAGYFPAARSSAFLAPRVKEFLPPELYRVFFSLVVEVAYHFFGRFPGYEFSCMSLLNTLYFLLYTHLPWRPLSREELGALSERMARMSRITRTIQENYRQKLLLRDLARQEGLTLSYLSHLFKDTMNMTFQEYLAEVRFEYASRLVASTDRGLLDICLESGFSDVRYLNKAFLRRYGCTPKAYRQSCRKGTSRPLPQSSLQQVLSEEESVRLLANLRGAQREVLSQYSLWNLYNPRS